jgi:hypothetical protein
MSPLTERNRQNAQSSTGPKTEEGKARSSQNSLVHGFYSKSALLPTENAAEYAAHQEAYLADLKPQGAVQADLALIVSDNMWCLRRSRALESAQSHSVDDCIYMARKTNAPILYDRVVDQTRALESIGRHQQRMQNAMLKALKQLKDLQRDSQNAPIPQPQPQPVETESGFVPATQSAAAGATASTPQTTPKTTPVVIIPAVPNTASDEKKLAA